MSPYVSKRGNVRGRREQVSQNQNKVMSRNAKGEKNIEIVLGAKG